MDIRPLGNVAQPSPALTEAGAPPVAPKTAAPVELPDAVQQAASVPNMEQLNNAVKEINRVMESLSRGVEFSVDDESHRTIVKIVDQTTKEVLRQMPSEEALAIAKALDRLQGLIIKQEA